MSPENAEPQEQICVSPSKIHKVNSLHVVYLEKQLQAPRILLPYTPPWRGAQRRALLCPISLCSLGCFAAGPTCLVSPSRGGRQCLAAKRLLLCSNFEHSSMMPEYYLRGTHNGAHTMQACNITTITLALRGTVTTLRRTTVTTEDDRGRPLKFDFWLPAGVVLLPP